MEHGIVKWYDKEKKYGFIRSDVGNKEYFVHSADIEEGSLEKGERVEFEIAETGRGPKATNVRILGSE